MTPFDGAACVAWGLATLADAWTTQRGLRHGLVEGNPVVRWIMGWAGPNGWVAVKIVLAALVGVALVRSGLGWTLWPVAALTGWVAWRNWRMVP
jgi:hypothetical protein